MYMFVISNGWQSATVYLQQSILNHNHSFHWPTDGHMCGLHWPALRPFLASIGALGGKFFWQNLP